MSDTYTAEHGLVFGEFYIYRTGKTTTRYRFSRDGLLRNIGTGRALKQGSAIYRACESAVERMLTGETGADQ